MNPTDLKQAKRAVRRAIIAERDAVAEPDRAARGRAIVQRYLELPEVARARTVMAFWSFGSEVPTAPLIDALASKGIDVTLPRIEEGHLTVRSWRIGEPLTETSFGAMEPAGGAPVDPASIDVVCVPGVAFDLGGRRVGYGAGYYDRFLTRVRPDALRAAIAFELQVVDVELPAGRFDLGVDAVVTERRTLRFQRAASGGSMSAAGTEPARPST